MSFLLNSYRFASASLLYNTVIGNMGGVITNATQLAAKLSIGAGSISYFNIDGNDVQAFIDVPYNINASAFISSGITRYDDFDSLIRIINSQAFQSCSSLSSFDFSGVTRINHTAFFLTPNLLTIDAPNLAQLDGNNIFRDCGVKTFIAPSLHTIGGGILIFRSTVISTFTTTGLLNLGATSGHDRIFELGNWSTCTMTLPVALSTNNAGGPDGDIAEVTGDGGTMVYV